MSLLLTGAGSNTAGVPAFDPTTLPQFAPGIYVAKSLSQNKLWQDTAKTTLATANGDPVAVARCPYTGLDWVVNTSTLRPTLFSEGGGKWSLSFPGSGQIIVLVAPNAGNLSAYLTANNGTVFVRYNDPVAVNKECTLCQTNDGVGGRDRYDPDNSSYHGELCSVGSRLASATPPMARGLNTILFRSSATRWERRTNSVADLTTTARYGAPLKVSVGGNLDGSSFITGRINAWGLCGDLTDPQAVQLETFLGTL